MIKGAQKRMIVVRTQDSEIFEEAYFVMRSGEKHGSVDMIGEADRIIRESGGGEKKRRERVSRVPVWCAVSFMGGSAAGALITALITAVSG